MGREPIAKLPREREWDEDDVLSLIGNGVKESITLDYKACDALQRTDLRKREVSKDVSAFANSAGGALVYGILENGYLPTAIDAGFDPADISKEWLEQVIASTIQPRISGVRVNQVDLWKTHPGRVLYVVEVPQTTVGGPHQAVDHRYYKRFNFQSVAMEDYEVKDIMRRAAVPDLFCAFFLPQPEVPVEFVFGEQFSQPLSLGIAVGNRASEPAFYALVEVFVDGALRVLASPDLERIEGAMLEVDNRPCSVTAFRWSWAIPANLPLFQGVNFRLADPPLAIAVPSDHADADGGYILGYRIMAPGMAEKQNFARLVLSQRKARIAEITTR